MSKNLMWMQMLGQMVNDDMFQLGKDKLENIDIQKEYLLIKQKKCRLSSSIRKLIVQRIED